MLHDRNVAAISRNRNGVRFSGIGLITLSLAALSSARADTTAAVPTPSPPPPADTSLTLYGLTFYGTVDLGVQYQTHGAPVSDYAQGGTESIIQKNSNKSVFAVTPSNLGTSRVGLQGSQNFVGDWAGIFKLETFFNPQSGNLSDGLKAITLANGKPLNQQTSNYDSSVAGQVFSSAAYAGVSSPTYGTITFGRNSSLLGDGVAKYDPQAVAQAFSPLGFTATTGGGGDTEDRRLDQSLRYTAQFAGIHVGALYQFNGSTGGGGTARQLQLGWEYLGGSIDAFYSNKKDAIVVSPLSAAQVTQLPALGFSSSNSVSATVSDNTAFSVMGSYSFGAPKFLLGYAHIVYKNPESGLSPGSDTIGGYVLAFVNNTAYNSPKTLQVVWTGLQYSLSPAFQLMGGYYGNIQKSYATGALAGCSGTQSAACSGNFNAFSLVGDYRFGKRFDIYAGSMWSEASNGLANGYLNKSTVTTTAGGRFRF